MSLLVIGTFVSVVLQSGVTNAPQPSESKLTHPLSFEPFVKADLKGPEWALNNSLKDFGQPAGHLSFVEQAQRVTLRLDVTNTSDEDMQLGDDVQALVTGRDNTGRSYSAKSLSNESPFYGNKYIGGRVIVGALRAHQTRSLLLHHNMPFPLPRAEMRFCFRLRISMHAAGQGGWQKPSGQACVNVRRRNR